MPIPRVTSVSIFCRPAPEADADKDGAIGGEVGDGMDGVGEEGGRSGDIAAHAFGDGEDDVDPHAHPGNVGDFPHLVLADIRLTAGVEVDGILAVLDAGVAAVHKSLSRGRSLCRQPFNGIRIGRRYSRLQPFW